MRVIAVDSSIVIAALLSWHEMHEVAADLLSRALTRDRVILPAAVLLESYSVMTRLPATHRLTPADAWTVLSETFREKVHLASVPARESWSLVKRLADAELGGGLVYDAAILEAAVDAGAQLFFTFNGRDFDRLDHDSIEIRVPE